MKRMLLAMAIGAATLPALPSDSSDSRIVNEFETALLRLADAGALPSVGQALVVERSPHLRYELGAVIDVRDAQEGGLPVLAVSPESAASRIGLTAGDRLIAMNEVSFTSSGNNAQAFREALASGQGDLQLKVRRGDSTLALAGRADVRVVPPFRLEMGDGATGGSATPGCGRVSLVLRPPVSKFMFPVALHEIDGRLGGPLDTEVFRLSAGRHVLKLSELIDGNRFTGVENRDRRQLFRYEQFKYLEIDVQPNTTYRLGVRFIKEHKGEIRSQKYWEPVVWSEASESCG